MNQYDVCVIGAGVVGCALARELRARHWQKNLSVAVFEKNIQPGEEASTRNSGVLHSGFHQNPESLKGKLARDGSQLALRLAEEQDIPLLKTGMLIAIPKTAIHDGLWKEAKNLWTLLQRGQAQKIKFQFLTEKGVQKLEPNIEALGGIFIPEVAIVDSKAFVVYLEKEAKNNGAMFYYNEPIIHIETNDIYYRIITPKQECCARIVINAAGIYADEIANMALKEKRYTLYPWRGEYYEIVSEKKNWIRRLVYPAVSPTSPGKGIHFSPRPDGRLFLGPNAVRAKTKFDYESDKTPLEVFLKAGRKFLPELETSDLQWGYSGIRAKLSDASHEDDFLINVDHLHPTLINLLGIESPGLSASLAIAKYVCTTLPLHLELNK